MKKLNNFSKNRFNEIQKSLTVLLFSIAFCCVTQAQNYKITFSGTGESTTVDSVRIQNLTQGTSISLLGTETLNLVQTLTGEYDFAATENLIKVYPNPMTYNTNLEFISTKSGEGIVQIFDIAGKQVAQDKQNLQAGKSIYQISGLKSGTYFIKIQLPNEQYSTELISTNGSNGIPKIYQLTKDIVINLKSANSENLVEMQYNEGDNLLFIGYSGTELIDTVEFILTADANIEFNFEALFDIDSVLAKSYDDFKSYIEYSFLFDAAYSNSKELSSNWNTITSHNQNSTDLKVYALWSDAYNVIYNVNSVIAHAESMSNESERQIKIAQAKCIRAYLYYTLVFWFGGTPIELGTSSNNSARSSENEVLDQILNDVEHAFNVLPQVCESSENIKLNKYFAAAIKARTLLLQNKFPEASYAASDIISSGLYSLTVEVDTFTSDSHENIFGFDEINDLDFKTNYDWQYVPAMRYTEIFLIRAESYHKDGDIGNAINDMNILLTRRGIDTLSSELSSNEIYEQWKTELKYEGCTFNYLKRFNKIQEELELYEEYKFVLPIPMRVIETNPNIFQNPGY